MTVLKTNPNGVVMDYVLDNGRDDIIRLFIKYNIPGDPTAGELLKAIRHKGKKFLHDFYRTIVMPYSQQMLSEMSSYNSAELSVAEDFASGRKNPNKGDNIIAGIATGLGVAADITGLIQTIRGNNKNNATTNQNQPSGTSYIPSSSRTKEEDEEKEKKTRIYFFVGAGLLAAIVMLFLFMHMNKK